MGGVVTDCCCLPHDLFGWRRLCCVVGLVVSRVLRDLNLGAVLMAKIAFKTHVTSNSSRDDCLQQTSRRKYISRWRGLRRGARAPAGGKDRPRDYKLQRCWQRYKTNLMILMIDRQRATNKRALAIRVHQHVICTILQSRESIRDWRCAILYNSSSVDPGEQRESGKVAYDDTDRKGATCSGLNHRSFPLGYQNLVFHFLVAGGVMSTPHTCFR